MLSIRESQSEHPDVRETPSTLVVSAGTTLGSLRGREGIRTAETLIIAGDHGLLGIVEAAAVRRCLNAPSSAERRRWNTRTIETLISTPLAIGERNRRKPKATTPVPVPDGEILCVPHFHENDVIGLSLDGQLFVNWEQIEPLLMSATTDPVTNLKSRAYFESCLLREFSRARVVGRSIGVLMFDVDHFKRVNDLCGHPLGDAVLHLVAECIRSALRADDIVTRYAGDEFAAICIDCDPDQVQIPVNRIQQTVRRLNVPACDDVNISVSIGAAIVSVWEESLTAGRLVEFADQCLYEAKAGGRDCAYKMRVSSHTATEDPIRIVDERAVTNSPAEAEAKRLEVSQQVQGAGI